VADAPSRSVLIIGLGNELRGDDGAGVMVARRLRMLGEGGGMIVREQRGDPTELIGLWQDRDAVVLVDTMRSGAPTGTVRRFDVSEAPLPVAMHGSSSTHALGLAEAIELARSLGRLPERVVVYAVEGSTFEAGSGLAPEVEGALAGIAGEVLGEARRLAR
jgi:hydrogenase maturation protease